MTIGKTLLAAGALVLLPLAASAAPGGGGEGGFHHGMRGAHFAFLRGVALTEAQKTQIHTLVKADWTTTKPEMQQLRSLHKQIEDALAQAGSVNESQLASLQQQAEQIRAKVAGQWLHTAIQVRSLLTPAQLSQAAQVHAKMASLHQQMRQVMMQAHEAAQ